MEKTALYIAGAALLVLLALTFALTQLNTFNSLNQKPTNSNSLPNTSSPKKEGTQESNTSSKTSVGEATSDQNTILYSDAGFQPSKVNLKNAKSSEDCLLRIENQSQTALLLRLSPYSPTDNQGFPYNVILTGKSGVIDPRYRIEKITFHNRNKPTDEFEVVLGGLCAQ